MVLHCRLSVSSLYLGHYYARTHNKFMRLPDPNKQVRSINIYPAYQ